MRFSLALVKRIHTHYISISLSFPLSYVAFHLSFRRQNSFYIVNYIVKIACRRFSTGKKNENNDLLFALRIKNRRVRVFISLNMGRRIPFGKTRGRKQLGDFGSVVCNFF